MGAVQSNTLGKLVSLQTVCQICNVAAAPTPQPNGLILMLSRLQGPGMCRMPRGSAAATQGKRPTEHVGGKLKERFQA